MCSEPQLGSVIRSRQRPDNPVGARGLGAVTLNRRCSAIVIGRGSQFILPEDSALRVRVVCPYEQRVSGYAEREKLSRQEAEQQVRHVERERQAFHRRYYQQEVGDPTHYDLVVNTGVLSVEACAGVVVAAYRAKFGEDS